MGLTCCARAQASAGPPGHWGHSLSGDRGGWQRPDVRELLTGTDLPEAGPGNLRATHRMQNKAMGRWTEWPAGPSVASSTCAGWARNPAGGDGAGSGDIHSRLRRWPLKSLWALCGHGC